MTLEPNSLAVPTKICLSIRHAYRQHWNQSGTSLLNPWEQKRVGSA
jgi:hypothetical protein